MEPLERYVPDDNYDYACREHKQRYLFSQQFVRNKTVLDAACGDGYGSSILSELAHFVAGIDISEATIALAKEKYKKDNLSFFVGSVEKLPFEDNFFDIVVSFETIEHVSENIQKSFLKEINRVLKKDGRLIMSTPNKEIGDITEEENQFHIREFYRNEFEDFIKTEFKHIEFCSQYYVDALLLHKSTEKKVPLTLDRIENGIRMDRYFIVVASQSALLEIMGAPILTSDREMHLESIALYKKIDTLSKNFLFSSLYIDYGNGYSENNRLIKNICADESGTFCVKFVVECKDDIVRIRFDPDEGHLRDISIDSVMIDGQMKKANALYALFKMDEYDAFFTFDPGYEISAPPRFKEVEIKGKVRPISVHAVNIMASKNATLKVENANLNSANSSLLSENSSLLGERDRLISEKSSLLGEKDRLIRENYCLLDDLSTIKRSRLLRFFSKLSKCRSLFEQ